MSSAVSRSGHAWPLGIKFELLGKAAEEGVVDIYPGITTLVGPNGSGKTRALRAVKTTLEATNLITRLGRKTHLLAAGRSSPFEGFRSAAIGPSTPGPSEAAVGAGVHQKHWSGFESVTGSLLALDSRADVRLKIEARLKQLFDRSINFSWSQQGLVTRVSLISGGLPYAINHEASCILHLVAILAAIYNTEIGALLIDEPEISLHPQHQAFLREEMENTAGDPSDAAKKLIIIATHSPILMPLRRIGELPNIVFFGSPRSPPAQVPADAGILQRTKIAAFVARLSTTHRIAMFADRVLLVEGPSDEIIATQPARRLDLRLLARNAQILPVMGKGEFLEAAKLFRLMNKQTAVLADLDALSDDSDLVSGFSDLPRAAAVADRLGRSSLVDLDGDLRAALVKFIDSHRLSVDTAAATYPDWSSSQSNELRRLRVTLARVLTDPASFGEPAAAIATSLRVRYEVLLKALAELGCFFLRRGAIDNYYQVCETTRSKPDRASDEASGFETLDSSELEVVYADLINALNHVAPNQSVDEDQLLRPKLGAALSAAFLRVDPRSCCFLT